jgi:hypothetical protein
MPNNFNKIFTECDFTYSVFYLQMLQEFKDFHNKKFQKVNTMLKTQGVNIE